MSTKPASRRRTPKSDQPDRRAPESARGLDVSLSRLKGLLNRPLALERRAGNLHFVLVDRRCRDRPDQPPTLEQVRHELRTRLLGHQIDSAAQVMRHLGHVHDVLGRKGWEGVGALTPRVLNRAWVQAQMLASDDPSPALVEVIDQLHRLKVAAELRVERQGRNEAGELVVPVEISEIPQEEFEELQRSWTDTTPSRLELHGRDD